MVEGTTNTTKNLAHNIHEVFLPRVAIPYGLTDSRFASEVGSMPAVVLPDESPGPVQPLLHYLEHARLMQDADVL